MKRLQVTLELPECHPGKASYACFAGDHLSLLALAPQQPVTIVGVTIPDDFQLGKNIVDRGRLLGSELDIDGVNVFDRAFGRARPGDGNDLSG